MPDSANARPITCLVHVHGKDYVWTEGLGLHPEAVTSVEGLIRKMAGSFTRAGMGGGLCYEDLVQEGRIGALEAAKRYDPTYGMGYAGYAFTWIRSRILTALHQAREVTFPRNHYQELLRTDKLPKVFSLTPLPGQDWSLETFLAADPDDHATSLLVEGLLNALRRIPGRDQEVLIRRFGLADLPEETFEAIGQRWGVSRERVRQIEQRALGRLRHQLLLAGIRPGDVL